MPEPDTLRTEYGVVARASRPGPLPFVLKDGETFGIFDAFGDIRPGESSEVGLFHEGMRHLSRLEVHLWGARPLLLSSTVREDNCQLTAHLTCPDVDDPEGSIAKGAIHIQRATVLADGSCAQRLRFTSYADRTLRVPLRVCVESDFLDIFEIRGMHRTRRGSLERRACEGALRFIYNGLDHRERGATVRVAPQAATVVEDGLELTLELAPRSVIDLHVSIALGADVKTPRPAGSRFGQARRDVEERDLKSEGATIHTSNEQFNDWINRSVADLSMLSTRTEHGLYPYAGVPWFSAPFGRDGLITARQCLTVLPSLARGVLSYLAATQATTIDPLRDAEPGKILHEARLGEMAALGEIPFGCYYGSVDATPLFVMLAGEHLARCGDVEFVGTLWPAIERAIGWIDEASADTGYLTYARASQDGLLQQGWKDSHDSVFHEDGADAAPPIALCEVQAYVYGARRAAATVARMVGATARSEELFQQAEDLAERFRQDFWFEEAGTFALALDGEGRQCRVRSSNAGHALLTGIASQAQARRVVESLMSPESFCGWGIRTIGESAARFNPMSYHNGSVWPHDNTLVALGMARYGMKHEALRTMTALFDASLFMPMHRLPELFCGFNRIPEEGPTLYPVACMPQAWASGAVFALLEACLGLSIHAGIEGRAPSVRLETPALPEYLQRVEITNLRVCDARVDLDIRRYESDVGVNVRRREGAVEVLVTK